MLLERRKMTQVTMPNDVAKWVPRSLVATLEQFDFTCDSGVSRTPYSCSGVSSRRIRARRARRTQQFDFVTRSASTEDSTSIRRQSSGPIAARLNPGRNPPKKMIQWWALWTFRPSSYFLSVNRRYLTRILDPKNRIKGIFSKKSEWLEKGIKNSLS